MSFRGHKARKKRPKSEDASEETVEVGSSMKIEEAADYLKGICGEGIILSLRIDAMTEQEHKELKQDLPGEFYVQLVAEGATSEKLEQFPAKLLKSDCYRMFPWYKAKMDFGFSSIKEVDSVKGEACITQTGLNCCQETLDMVVTAIYSRAIAINAGNLVEILRAADYLQAGWLAGPISSWLQGVDHSLAIYELHQKGIIPDFDVSATVAKIAEGSLADIRQLLLLSCPHSDPLAIMTTICRHKPLSEILALICDDSIRSSGWKLSKHLKAVLLEQFPDSKAILDHLTEETSLTATKAAKANRRLAITASRYQEALERHLWREADETSQRQICFKFDKDDFKWDDNLQAISSSNPDFSWQPPDRIFSDFSNELEYYLSLDQRGDQYELSLCAQVPAYYRALDNSQDGIGPDKFRLGTENWSGPLKEKYHYFEVNPVDGVHRGRCVMAFPGLMTRWLKDKRRFDEDGSVTIVCLYKPKILLAEV